MPEIDIAAYEKIAPVDLEQRRRAIVAKANGQHDNLSIDELHELAAVTTILRRRASGPPKATRAKSASAGAGAGKPAKPSIMDLA